ncbi:MAG: (Fe-S)-binding protein [Bacillota bacterium]
MKPHNPEVWYREAIKCSKCGVCRSVCPVFAQLNHETLVARGKMTLIEALLQQQQEFSPRLQEVLSLCLVCKTCTVNCPSGVPIDQLVTRARTAFATKPLPWGKRLVFSLVRRHSLMNACLRLAGKLQKAAFKLKPDGQGMMPRLPLGISRRRLLAPLAGKAFVDRQPHKTAGGIKVAFFAGCMINHIYHSVGTAVLEVLQAGGVEAIVPREQACCGTPIAANGDRASAAELARHNILELAKSEVDGVVVACASCGCTLKNDYIELCAEYYPDLVGKAQELSKRVYDITEFYQKYLGHLQLINEVPLRATYHDPCHLLRGQGISKEPRQVIKLIPGINFIEAADAGKCCGSGGSFSLRHYDLAVKLNDEKMETLINTGADTVVTGCPACMMHISDGSARTGIGIKVLHTVELLALSVRK